MDIDEDDDRVDFDQLIAQSDAQLHPQAQALEDELDAAKRKRKLVVATNDVDVRKQLRSFNEPITLFGERPGDRRDRLRGIISQIQESKRARGDISDNDSVGSRGDSSDSEREEEFYTPGDAELLQQRRAVAQYSLKRARKRIARQQVEADLPLATLLNARKAVFAELKTYTALGTQLADDRGIAITRFSPNSKFLATGSWSGAAKIWDVPNARCLAVYKGHGPSRIGGLAWHPEATLSQSSSVVNFATAGEDGFVNLWPIDQLQDPSLKSGEPEAVLKPLATLSGHAGMVRRVAFHPTGHYLASAGYDETWRLWDVEKQRELLIQEGHSKSVYAVAFQSDGALLCSGGADALGRVWDLRSGKTVMILDGHVNDVLAIDFAPNGHQIATGSSDDTARIWDMRTLRSIYTIAAHAKNVADLCFFRSDSGTFPFTLSAKAAVKAEVKQEPTDYGLEGPDAQTDEAKVKIEPVDEPESKTERDTRQAGQVALNAADDDAIKPPLDGMYLATAGYDSTVKLWSADDWQLVKTIGMEKGSRVMSVDLSRDGKFLAAGEFNRTFKLIAASGVQL